jgi:hypothetical protein
MPSFTMTFRNFTSRMGGCIWISRTGLSLVRKWRLYLVLSSSIVHIAGTTGIKQAGKKKRTQKPLGPKGVKKQDAYTSTEKIRVNSISL